MDTSECSCEPMDVDLSVNSVKSMDTSTSTEVQTKTVSPKNLTQRVTSAVINDTLLHHLHRDAATVKVEWNIKKFHLKKEPVTKRKALLKAKFVVAIIVLCFSMIGYYATNTSCNEGLQLDLIETVLTTKLYGQRYAVDQIIKTLKVKTSSKILFFYGGTGVGKTYTASLILKDSWNYSNVYHFTMPSLADTFTTNLLSGLILCKSAVIVVDNLNQNDLNVRSHIRDIVEKSEYLGKNLTIIAIYNCDTVSAGFVRKCNSSFLDELKEDYREIKALKVFVKFETLSEQHLKKCIEDEIGLRTISEAQMTQILKNFDVLSDGCKGVHTKIKFLNTLL